MGTIKKFDVFLSHNSKDKTWVINLKNALESFDVKVWLDKDEIRPGDMFAEALEKGIEESRAVALIISPEAMASGWVKAEYYRALSLATNNQLQLIPVLYKNAEIPGFLRDRSWVDFSNEVEYDEKVNDLIWGITGKKISPKRRKSRKGNRLSTKEYQKINEIDSLLSHINNPLVRDLERNLRMENAHWLQAGFQQPKNELNFTSVYYENQIEVFKRFQLFLQKTKMDISNRKADLIQDAFLDSVEDNLNQIILRVMQIEELLLQKEFELSITVYKAGQTILRDVEKVRNLALYAPMKLLAKPRDYDRISRRLSTEMGNLSISIEEYQKYLTLIVKQSRLEKIYSS